MAPCKPRLPAAANSYFARSLHTARLGSGLRLTIRALYITGQVDSYVFSVLAGFKVANVREEGG